MIHSHPKNGCLFKILKNKINEKLIFNSKSLEFIHNKNDISYPLTVLSADWLFIFGTT